MMAQHFARRIDGPAGFYFTSDEMGRRIAVQDPLDYRTTTVFDAMGREQARVDELGYVTTNAYDLVSRPT
jgi:hypothetical protein